MDTHTHGSAFSARVLAELASFSDFEPEPLTTFDTRQARAALVDADFLITGWGSPVVDLQVLSACPKLRLIAHAAGSVRHHLTDEVWGHGVYVSSAADVNAEPVAQYTVAVITLAMKRAFAQARRFAEQGVPAVRSDDMGLTGRTVGVIGASRIGRRVLTALSGMNVRLLVADPHVSAAAVSAMDAELVDVDSLCRFSDVVTVHAPELPATRHLLDERRLGLLRDGAVVVNTARGSLIDTDALVRHCGSGRLDAVLDVTDPEPLPLGHPLLTMSNVWITPHLAGSWGTEVAALGAYAVGEVRRFFSGEHLRGLVSLKDLATMA